jgi:Ribonuclease G/E
MRAYKLFYQVRHLAGAKTLRGEGLRMLFRVRGIYATALTSLLMKEGHQPTQASKAVASRLSLPPITLPPDVDIHDLPDKGGVIIEGDEGGVEEALKALMEKLPDATAREHRARLNAVYKGVVTEVRNGGCYVELGGFKGFIPKASLREGEEVAVTVVKCLPENPILSVGLRVAGSYAKLIQGHGVSISRGLRGSRRAEELLTLAQALKLQGWGIRWRRSAAYAPLDELLEEVELLKKRAEQCLRKVEESKAPAMITPGDRVVELRIYGASKAKLDEVRAEVCPTIPRHHLLKTWGKAYSMVVDLLESLQPPLPKEVMAAASDKLIAKAFKPGSKAFIRHLKPTGEALSLTPGKVVSVEGGLLKLERRFKGKGVYDGLGAAKEEGDWGLTVFKEGSWASYTAYFSKAGLLKGVYFNVSTPPDFKPGEVSYLDLIVDVAWTPQAGARLMDVEELEKAETQGILSKHLAERALKVAKGLSHALSSRDPLSIDLSSLTCSAFKS